MDFITILITTAWSHPEMIKDFVLFFFAWLLLKKGIEKNFNKLTDAIENLASAVKDQGQHFNERVTKLEDQKKIMSETIISLSHKVDNLINKGE